MRVLSLLPSATEIVCRLGAESELVGRSEECDFPSSVRSLPIVMKARSRDAVRSSIEIDRRVRASLASGESLYELDLELLRRLRPDLILSQDLCDVCSVTGDEVVGACRTVGLDPRILSLSPRSLTDVRASIVEIGSAIGRAAAGRALAETLERQEGSAAVDPSRAGGRPTVLVLEWVDPPIVAGLWTPEIIERAGGAPVGPRPGEPSRRFDWQELGPRPPALVLVSPCSFAVERTRRELEGSSARRELAWLAESTGIWLADEAYFSRPGPRLWTAIDLVRTLLGGGTPSTALPVERWRPVAPLAPGGS